jgi:hypothetical protein
MRSRSRGASRLSVIPLVVMGALAAWELWRGLGSPFRNVALLTSVLLLAAGVVAALHLASGRGPAAIRRGAWLSALITLVLIANCSATGVSNARGTGYELALAAPLVFLGVFLVLVGPLLASLIAPALFAEHRRAAAVASIASGVLALITAEAGLVASFSGVCSRAGSSAGESACVTAASGALAGLFGLFGMLLVIPFTTRKSSPGASAGEEAESLSRPGPGGRAG